MNYKDFKFLSFDCYGTLIDWESGIWNAFQPVILFNNRNDLTREKVLRNFALASLAPLRSAKSNFYVEHDSASQIVLNQISARRG